MEGISGKIVMMNPESGLLDHHVTSKVADIIHSPQKRLTRTRRCFLFFVRSSVIVRRIVLHQPRRLYFVYGEWFPVVAPLTASTTFFPLTFQMISAAPSRFKALLASVYRRPLPRTAQSARHYTNGQKQEEPVIPPINELLSKKSIKNAWAGEWLGDDEERNW